jgi:hypothetical protein
MKPLLTFAMLTMALVISGKSTAQVAQPAPAEPKISITIRTAQNAVKVGSDVEVEVKMENISAEDLFYGVPGLFGAGTTSFRWEIRDSKGTAIPMTEYGIKANHLEPPQEGVPPHVDAGSAFAGTLGPGKSVVQKLALSKEYDLNKPGKYTIQALHFDGKMDVKSNTITLTVTP